MKDLILTSIKAHQVYVVSRTKSKMAQSYYNEMSNYIFAVISTADSYFLPLIVLEQSFASLRPTLFSFNYELKYKKLAIKHASEIVLAIHNRFNGKLHDQN